MCCDNKTYRSRYRWWGLIFKLKANAKLRLLPTRRQVVELVISQITLVSRSKLYNFVERDPLRTRLRCGLSPPFQRRRRKPLSKWKLKFIFRVEGGGWDFQRSSVVQNVFLDFAEGPIILLVKNEIYERLWYIAHTSLMSLEAIASMLLGHVILEVLMCLYCENSYAHGCFKTSVMFYNSVGTSWC